MKRVEIAISALMLGLLPATGKAVLLGDVNLDGQVTSADYTLLNQYLAATATLNWDQRDAADVAPLGSNDLVGDGVVDSADAVVFDSALQGNDVDGDGLNVASEIGGTTATNGSPFLKDTDRDSSPDNVDSTRGSFNANAAPSTPTLSITSVTGTTLGGTISTCSNPDGLPYPSTCTQQVRVVAAGGGCESATVITPITPSSGSWSATGLTAGVIYSVYGHSSDGSLAACSTAATQATTPTANAPVSPYLNALPASATTNPVTLTGIAAPGQEIRVWVNGLVQDYVRSFVAGNSEYPTNPFFAAASTGTFSVPVILNDALNIVQVTAIGAGSAESAPSNSVTTTYDNNLSRSTLGLPVVNESGINRYVVNKDANGQIHVLTKGVAPGTTGEYVPGANYVEVKAQGLLIIQPGAIVRFDTVATTGTRPRLLVGGSLQALGTELSRAKIYSPVGTSTTLSWKGIEFQSTARINSIHFTDLTEGRLPIEVIGTSTARPDLIVTRTDMDNSQTGSFVYTGVQVGFGGSLTLRDNYIRASHTSSCKTGPAISVSDSTATEIVGNQTIRTNAGILVSNTAATIESNVVESRNCESTSMTISRGISLIGGPSTSRVSKNMVREQWDEPETATTGHFARGIHVEDTAATIEDNLIRNARNGIAIQKVGGTAISPIVRNNIITTFITGSTPSNPSESATLAAVEIFGQAGAVITGNKIWSSNNSWAERAIRVNVAGSTPIDIIGNQFFFTAFGVQIMNGSSVPAGEDVEIRANSFDNISRTGIYLENSNSRIEHNTFLKCGNYTTVAHEYLGAVYMTGSSSVVVNNEVRESRFGIRANGGTPEITLNRIWDGTIGGILLSGTSAGTTVSQNTVQGYVSTTTAYGIRLQQPSGATTSTQATISGNVITGNSIGVYVVGTGNPANALPLPVVQGNNLVANQSGTTLQNFVTSSYSSSSLITLDATSNWWGVASPTQATAGIVIGSVGSGVVPAVDFSSALAGPGTNLLVGGLYARIGTSDSENVFFVPNPSGSPPPVATIYFTVYDPAASIVLRICLETVATCNAASALYSSSGQTFSAGLQSLAWNGTDGAGQVVADEAYTFALEATKGALVQDLDDSGLGARTSWEGTENGGLGVILSTTYDTYKNDALQSTVQMTAGYRPGRIFLDVLPLDALGRPKRAGESLVSPVGYPNGAPLPVPASSYVLYTLTWSGRDLLANPLDRVGFVVRVFPMRKNVIIVKGAKPIITGATGSVNITVNPYLVHDVFEQVASFSFKVDRLSDVTIALLPPNSWSDTSAPTWVLNNVAANTSTPLVFRGHEVVGMQGVSADQARNLLTLLSQEGVFTFRIRAEDEVTRRTTDAYVTLQLRH